MSSKTPFHTFLAFFYEIATLRSVARNDTLFARLVLFSLLYRQLKQRNAQWRQC
jgi:hypothetical protein